MADDVEYMVKSLLFWQKVLIEWTFEINKYFF